MNNIIIKNILFKVMIININFSTSIAIINKKSITTMFGFIINRLNYLKHYKIISLIFPIIGFQSFSKVFLHKIIGQHRVTLKEIGSFHLEPSTSFNRYFTNYIRIEITENDD